MNALEVCQNLIKGAALRRPGWDEGEFKELDKDGKIVDQDGEKTTLNLASNTNLEVAKQGDPTRSVKDEGVVSPPTDVEYEFIGLEEKDGKLYTSDDGTPLNDVISRIDFAGYAYKVKDYWHISGSPILWKLKDEPVFYRREPDTSVEYTMIKPDVIRIMK